MDVVFRRFLSEEGTDRKKEKTIIFSTIPSVRIRKRQGRRILKYNGMVFRNFLVPEFLQEYFIYTYEVI